MSDQPENSSAEARPRGILSSADREYLRGERDLSGSAERNTRQRIRERIQAGLADFELLWSLLPDHDLEQVFYPDDSRERQRIRSWSQQALAVILLGLWMNRDPHWERIEDAIEQAAFASGQLAKADVELQTETAPDGELLLAQIQHKQQRIEQLQERIEQGDLGESDITNLEAELEKEEIFQYQLFEKALIDSSVDPDKLSSLSVFGAEFEMSAEDIEQTQTNYEESPIARRSFPVIVDKSYLPEEAEKTSRNQSEND